MAQSTPKLPPVGHLADGTPDYYDTIGRAAARVRTYWQIGHKSRDTHPTWRHEGSKEAEVQRLKSERAADMKWSLEALRVVRRFAERCRESTLEQMLNQAQAKGVEPSIAVFVALFEVTNAQQRRRLWKQSLAAGGWSKSQCEAAIRQSGAPRESSEGAGRTPRLPATPKELVDRLRQAASSFTRLAAVAGERRNWLSTTQRRHLAAAKAAAARLGRALRQV